MAIKIISGSSLKDAEAKTRREFGDREYQIISRSKRPHDSLLGRLVGREIIQLVVSDDIPLIKNARDDNRRRRNEIVSKAYSQAGTDGEAPDTLQEQKNRVLKMMEDIRSVPRPTGPAALPPVRTENRISDAPTPAVSADALRPEPVAVGKPQKEGGAVADPGPGANGGELFETLQRIEDLLRIVVADTSPQHVKAELRKIFVYYKRLYAQGVEPGTLDKLFSAVAKKLTPEERKCSNKVFDEFIGHIASHVELFEPREVNNRPKIVTLIGPTGAGKTTTLPKLAMQYVNRGRKIGFLTLDTYRIGAIDQLKVCADIMDIPIRSACTVEEAVEAVKAYYACDTILVDTAGRSPKDEEILGETRRMLREIEPDETFLVLSANASAGFLSSVMREFGSIPYDAVIFTKLDEMDTYGHLFNTIVRFKKPLAYFCTGQNIPQDFEVADRTRFARLLLEKDRIGEAR